MDGWMMDRKVGGRVGGWTEARCLPLSESEGKRGGYVIPKYALRSGSKDES